MRTELPRKTTSRMRLAIAVTEFPVVSQTFVLDHVTGLIARGYDAHIHARKASAEPVRHSEIADASLLARTRYLPLAPPSTLPRLVATLRLLRANPACFAALLRGVRADFWPRLYAALPFRKDGPRYALIHAHFGQNGMRLLPLYDLGLLRAPLVVTFHGHDMHGYLADKPQDFHAELFARSAALIVCSAFMRERLLARGAPAEKLHCIPNGISVDRFAFRPRSAGTGPAQLLTIGRLVPFKGHTHLLAALSTPLLAPRDWVLHVVGDGPLMQSLKAQAAPLGGKVVFHGALPREKVLQVLERADLYLAPAVVDNEGNTETQGMALLEAMASGLPVIASAVGGIPETLGEAAAALVPPGDAQTLARAIAALLDAPLSWAAHGRVGRARVKQHYGNAEWLNALEKLYATLQEENKSA